MPTTEAPSRSQTGLRTQAVAERGPVDWEVLRSFHEFGGEDDAGIVGHLVHLYLDTAPGHLRMLREALESGNAEALEFTAHTMKGTAATIGARGLAVACRDLETAARAGAPHARVAELFEAVAAEFGRVRAALDLRPPFLAD